MFTILDGEIELTFRGIRAVATAGETINVPANAPHVFRNVSERPARLLCLCSPAGQEEFFKEVGVPVAHRTEAPRRSTMPPPARSSPRRSHSPRSTGPSCCSANRSPDPGAGETTVSQQQRDALDQLLREAPLDLGGDVAEQRVIFEEMIAAIPVPADVTTSSGSLGGIPVVNVEAAGADRASVIFYPRLDRKRQDLGLIWRACLVSPPPTLIALPNDSARPRRSAMVDSSGACGLSRSSRASPREIAPRRAS